MSEQGESSPWLDVTDGKASTYIHRQPVDVNGTPQVNYYVTDS